LPWSQGRLGRKRLGLSVSKHDGCELEDVCVLILPATGAHPSFGAGFFEELRSAPFLFHRNLRKQEALVGVILHQQAVLADFDLSNIEHAPQRRKHRDFVFELRQFRG
jgi:hypothetical protein